MSYADDQADAAAMLAEDGQSVTVTRSTPGTYDPATGEVPLTVTTQTLSGVFLPLSTAIRYGFKQESGSVIVAGDQQLLLSATGSEPRVGDTVTDASGRIWTIIALDPLNPAGTPILYDCVARRNG